jgi:hypothetical protein
MLSYTRADATTARAAGSKRDVIGFDDFARIEQISEVPSLPEPRVPGTGHLRFFMGFWIQAVSLRPTSGAFPSDT